MVTADNNFRRFPLLIKLISYRKTVIQDMRNRPVRKYISPQYQDSICFGYFIRTQDIL